MPELPEVETVRRALAGHLPGRSVLAVRAAAVRLRRPIRPDQLQKALIGGRFLEPNRHGKWLLLPVADRGTLAIHLGMSGRLRLWDDGTQAPPHTHLEVELDGGPVMALVDPRRFGAVAWLAPGAADDDPALSRLGPDALDPALPSLLPGELRRRRTSIKATLMDQRLVAGIGNIYANEALWRARIHPAAPAGSISRRRLQLLVDHVQAVLAEAIERGGTTLRDFAGVDGTAGMFRLELAVYGEEGEPCPRCGASIRRTVIAQRATYLCPRCQRR